MNESDYSQHDHAHCPQTNSPCGFEGQHRCCLCKKPVDTSDNWQERFDMAFPSKDEGDTPIPLTSKRFLEWQSIRDKGIKQFIAKEKERSREEAYKPYRKGREDENAWFKSGSGVDYLIENERYNKLSFEAGKATMLASVREKVAGMKKEIPDHECNSTAYCVHYPISDIKNNALQNLLDALSTLEENV